MGSIIFVHGTGVRGNAYQTTFDQIEKKLNTLKSSKPRLSSWNLISCLWGDQCGVKLHLEGKSLPNYKGAASNQKPGDVMVWWLLYQDPEMEMRVWEATEKTSVLIPPGSIPKWKTYDRKITNFSPTPELESLLIDSDINDYWKEAREELLKRGGSYERAIQTIMTDQDFQSFSRLFARALVARATILAQVAGKAVPTVAMRDEVVTKMTFELGIPTMGLRSWSATMVNEASIAWSNTVELLKVNVGLSLTYAGIISRDTIHDVSFRPSGDILFYQARGQKIRDFIRKRIDAAEKPIVLLAHSLGGIACVDLMIDQELPEVKGLITAGSQAPVLYEMNALSQLEAGQPLPGYFPDWLNIYDLSDLLSYPAAEVFAPKATDKRIYSGLPYLQAHSGYWSSPEVWDSITDFILNRSA